MEFLILVLLAILIFTAIAIEKILKEIRSQNQQMIELLKHGRQDGE